ncbi:MerR family transcriptional regulator [Actinoalloteichus caeruleus]|uniref:MerR family transcriptional regulator n=1 Tax=Actinoalloteichus cyanogriseus TaxID=2893586 RepID=UPI0004AA5482|nr:MerR family transcriptional regulator [Actinoalloteichus caeruleus]
MRIGELSRRTGASVRSLRYYEERGLIAAERGPSGQRHYADHVVERVLLVRRLLEAGLGTHAIADVLPCLADPATQTTSLTSRLVVERDRLAREIAERRRMRDALDRFIDQAPPLAGAEGSPEPERAG